MWLDLGCASGSKYSDIVSPFGNRADILGSEWQLRHSPVSVWGLVGVGVVVPDPLAVGVGCASCARAGWTPLRKVRPNARTRNARMISAMKADLCALMSAV